MSQVSFSSQFHHHQPDGERLEPLGAADAGSTSEKPASKDLEEFYCSHSDSLASLEEERDLLQSSLFALTTHFAQVQLRLRQVAAAPIEQQEDLLKSLEEFAFCGINPTNNHNNSNKLFKEGDSVDLIEEIRVRRKQQNELLKQLKGHLHQLDQPEEINLDQLVNDLELKQRLEDQLRTQILDLERFVSFLKKSECECKRRKSLKTYFIQVCEQISSFLQIFALMHHQFGFRRSAMKRPCPSKFQSNHWGDLRAQLELTIINLKHLLRNSHNDDARKKNNITVIVRKYLSRNICALIEHGTKPSNMNLVPFLDCFSRVVSTIHGWDIILDYYRFKNGNEFNTSTVQKLSQSYNLDLDEASPKQSKKNLLCVIGDIIATHTRMKRSNDSHFKAFICAGLNANTLVVWLNSILHCGHIVRTYYYPWSYVASTGYEDGLRSLDVLTGYKFQLPVDLDVDKFRINDFI